MAQATATCTCATCGAEFIKIKTCYSRREADSWEAWATENIVECGTCYKARMRAAEAARPLTLHLTADPCFKDPMVVLFWGGDAAAHKDVIKALGYRWVDANRYVTYGYNIRSGDRRWIKTVSQEDAYAEIQRAQEAGAEIDSTVVNVKHLASLAAAKQARIDAAADLGITEPTKPGCYPTGRWNGKIYGKAEYGYRIYVDNQEARISDDDASALRAYSDARRAWEDAINGSTAV